ncbi:MAG: TPR end-of-group domain-containing protein [Bryobacteraceae bacterium]
MATYHVSGQQVMKRQRAVLCCMFCVLCLPVVTFAQNAAAQADAVYEAKNWSEAAKLYSDLANANPAVARYWYRLGVAAQASGQHERALEAFLQAKDKGGPPVLVAYNLACAYASLKRPENAMAELSEAVKAGFAQPEEIETDSNLEALRGNPRFATLIEQARRNQQPCEYQPENRQLDFWLGEWNVVPTSGGGSVGASRIEKALRGCVIWENWSSLGSTYAGKSYNTWNASLKRWEQFWVDNSGGMIHFYGALKESVMDFWTDDIPQPDGTKLRRHLQFFNLGPNKVRQFSQGSKDRGKTWSVEYDFTYLRKASSYK